MSKFSTPKDLRIYHLLVDRFCGRWSTPPASIDDFLGGNLAGILARLDYIRQLGFNAILLTPFLSTNAYHGYHIVDYDKVDERFGDWEVFERLVDAAHARGIKVICDFVPNHCHYNNVVFQQALKTFDSPYRKWFFFNAKDTNDYVSFLNLPDLPKFNLENADAARFMISKAVRLAQCGVDGFRIDHALGQPFAFLSALRKSVRAVRDNIFVIGEVWAAGVSLKLYSQFHFKDKVAERRYKKSGINQELVQQDYVGVLDGVLDFAFRDIVIDEIRTGRRLKGNATLRRKLVEHFKQYPFEYMLVLFLDNHDTNRALFECNNDVTLLEEAIDLMKGLNRPFTVLYGTEQLMTTQTSIINAEPYADLRVRQCIDWRKPAANILKVENSSLTAINQYHMPIVNGEEWSMDKTSNADATVDKQGDVQPRRVSEKGNVNWNATEPRWPLDDLILSSATRQLLSEIAAFVAQYKAHVGPWGLNRFLRGESCVAINFYGVPGTGKSISAEAVAKACDRKVIKASYSQIQSDRWGGTENNLTSLFETARDENAVIILDEADALFSKRRSEGANSETNNQIKSHLLNLMDSYEVVLVLTTNRFGDYDEAFYRRTMFQIEFPLPTHDELVLLWKMHLGCAGETRYGDGEVPKAGDFSFEEVATASHGLSGGDIRRITLTLVSKVLGRDDAALSSEQVVAAIDGYNRAKAQHAPSGPRPVVGEEKKELKEFLDKAQKESL